METQSKPVEVEPDEAKKLISSLCIFIMDGYKDVKTAELDLKTSTEPNTQKNKTEELRIQTIEFYGLMLFSFGICESYLTNKEDIDDHKKYTDILQLEDMEITRKNLTDLKNVSMRLLKNSGLSTLSPLSRVNEVKTQINMKEI